MYVHDEDLSRWIQRELDAYCIKYGHRGWTPRAIVLGTEDAQDFIDAQEVDKRFVEVERPAGTMFAYCYRQHTIPLLVVPLERMRAVAVDVHDRRVQEGH